MKAKELQALGIPRGGCLKAAFACVAAGSEAGLDRESMLKIMKEVVADPTARTDHEDFGELARALLDPTMRPPEFVPREEPAPWRQWGENLEEGAVKQMQNACALPVSVMGALMPDAHLGYGLPIGGVLATEGAVIPYAVGMDIACRMKLSVIDLPTTTLDDGQDRLTDALERETRFGVGAKFRDRREHEVMDEDWSVSPVTERLKDKGWAQLGTSGSGNHFAEFGIFSVEDAGGNELGLDPGSYLALLSHSGSRGTGGDIAKHYSQVAADKHLELPRELAHLAWLDLDSEEGQEYWAAMELMGLYAAANHSLIHRHVLAALGAKVLLDIENHHNFAWKETVDGREVIVHRKGATPAAEGDIGIIPGSMATPAYVVRGKGSPASIRSAAHGAGRRMSRKAAMEQFTWNDARAFLEQRGVTLISGGLDEVPMAYKDIDEVMAAQADLVEPLARFQPKLVKMAPGGDGRRRRRRKRQ